MCLLVASVSMGSVGDVSGQVKNYFLGDKKGERYNPGGLGFGSSGIGSPFSLNFLSVTSYSAPLNSLNHDAANFAKLTTSRAVLNAAGGDVFVTFSNLSTIPSGTTTYVRLKALPSTNGGLGSLLSIGGLGNSFRFFGRGYMGSTSVSSHSELLMDSAGKYYLAVQPFGNYNVVRVDLQSEAGLLAGILNLLNPFVASVELNSMFYYSGFSSGDCGRPLFTSLTKANGVTASLDSLNITGFLGLSASVKDPHKAIDGDISTYSSIVSPVLGLASSVSQIIYFGYPGQATDLIKIRFALPLSFLTLGILDKISIQAYNGTAAVGSSFELKDLINLSLLGLLGSYEEFEVNVRPSVVYDRVEIRVASGLSVNINDEVRIHDVSRVVAPPTISAQPSDVLDICEGQPASLSVSTSTGSNLSYLWAYKSASSTNWQSFPNSNSNPFIINNIPLSYDSLYYKVTVKGGVCPTNLATVVSDSAQLTVKPKPITPAAVLGP